jgi:hypothetical protein
VRSLAHANIQASKHAEFHALDLVLDLGCEASPVVAANSATQPGSEGVRTGARLPHRWLSLGRSLYDELGEGMTLLVLTDGCERDVTAIAGAADDARVPLRVLDLSERRPRGYGADLVLVRPDQHIAWCANHVSGGARTLIDRIRGVAG